jgi:hypothetical protein
MDILKTTPDKITKLRRAHFETLPEFQEFYLELMVHGSEVFILQENKEVLGYAITSSEGMLIEYYLRDRYVPKSQEIFPKLVHKLSIREILCKTFDAFLLSKCILNSFAYEVVGVLYRDSINLKISKDPEIRMLEAKLSSLEILLKQDDSIHALFETESQLAGFFSRHKLLSFKTN